MYDRRTSWLWSSKDIYVWLLHRGGRSGNPDSGTATATTQKSRSPGSYCQVLISPITSLCNDSENWAGAKHQTSKSIGSPPSYYPILLLISVKRAPTEESPNWKHWQLVQLVLGNMSAPSILVVCFPTRIRPPEMIKNCMQKDWAEERMRKFLPAALSALAGTTIVTTFSCDARVENNYVRCTMHNGINAIAALPNLYRLRHFPPTEGYPIYLGNDTKRPRESAHNGMSDLIH
ncbi:hypothetical protein BD779DRAFT_1471201 [Infundibulicybe gibba]|nr:hypothetical protein BD779DRAFT_1471201 [Infundibulicybe gibba]